MFCHTLSDLHFLHPSTHTPIFYVNHGAVDWSHIYSTKDMCHLNIEKMLFRFKESHSVTLSLMFASETFHCYQVF
jgi:hypothetical protein